MSEGLNHMKERVFYESMKMRARSTVEGETAKTTYFVPLSSLCGCNLVSKYWATIFRCDNKILKQWHCQDAPNYECRLSQLKGMPLPKSTIFA